MSQCSQTVSVDFPEFLLKRRHLKNFKKSVNKCVKIKKFNLQNHHRLFILRDDFEKLFNNDDEKWSENSIVK